MPGPTWLSRTFAAVMIAVALYHAARIVRSRSRARPIRYDVDVTHLAIGVAMAMMLAVTLSPTWNATSAVAFAAPTLWFSWRGMRLFVFDGVRSAARDVSHALACAAMLYMLLAASAVGATARLGVTARPGMDMGGMPMPSMSGSSGPWPVAAAALAVLMLGVAASFADRLRRLAVSQPAGAPVLAHGRQLAMSSTMVHMLATSL